MVCFNVINGTRILVGGGGGAGQQWRALAAATGDGAGVGARCTGVPQYCGYHDGSITFGGGR